MCGWGRWAWWAPAVGYGLLLVYFGQIVRLPDHQRSLIGVGAIVILLTLALPTVRRSIVQALPDGLPLGILLILIAAIPFFAAGHTGVLGASVSNDMSQHLLGEYYIRTRDSALPVAAIGGDLITTGYPLGPHGLAAALTRISGLGDETGFSAVTLAIPVLTAFAALGLVPMARRAARWALALVAGLGYMPAAYLAQGSFKETIAAMFVLATAAVLVDLKAEHDAGPVRLSRGLRLGIPVGVMLAASVYTYSYGGALWIVAVAGLFLAWEVLARRELFSVVRRWLWALIGAAVAAVVLIEPDYTRIKLFKKSIFGAEALHNKGNLYHALNPLESFGLWFSGDFRFNPDPSWPTYAFTILAMAALLAGLPWWWRRRALAIPIAALAAAIVFVELVLTVNIYNSAKGLVVMAPVLMVTIGAPLAAAWGARGTSPRGLWLLRAARVLGVVLFGGAVVATFGVLRSAPVGLGPHEQELAKMRPLVHDKAVLFLDNDHFAQWELRGANPLFTTNSLYAPAHLGMHPAKNSGFPFDADNFGERELDQVAFIVSSAAAYRSEIPPNFHLAMRTRSYDLFRRVGATPHRTPIEPPFAPGAIFDCNSKLGKRFLASYKWAGVLPTPVVSSDWQGTTAKPGQTATLHVKLPRGHWDLSLEYVSQVPLRVRAPGVDQIVEPNFGLITTYWPGGTVTSDGRPVTISVTAQKRSWFGQLLGTPRPTLAPLSPGSRPIFNAAFTRHDVTPRRVPVASACGRYVDWFAPAGSHMRGRLGHHG